MKLLASSVVRGSFQGDSHGGVYLIDIDGRTVDQKIDWNKQDIDWRGRGWDRGLRGISFFGGLVWIAASDELFAFTPDFKKVGSWKNRYLKHCHEIFTYNDTLFLTSTGYDVILGFDLNARLFNWALHVDLKGLDFVGKVFDPNGDKGPIALNKFHLNSITASDAGLYFSGLKSGGMLLFNGHMIQMSATLPEGTHNVQPFRDGILFNDTQADVLRYAGRSGEEDRALKVVKYDSRKLENVDLDNSQIARQGFARGLCVISDRIVAGGSSPSTVSLYDLEENERLLSVNLTMDVRNAIHGLEVWPY